MSLTTGAVERALRCGAEAERDRLQGALAVTRAELERLRATLEEVYGALAETGVPAEGTAAERVRRLREERDEARAGAWRAR